MGIGVEEKEWVKRSRVEWIEKGILPVLKQWLQKRKEDPESDRWFVVDELCDILSSHPLDGMEWESSYQGDYTVSEEKKRKIIEWGKEEGKKEGGEEEMVSVEGMTYQLMQEVEEMYEEYLEEQEDKMEEAQDFVDE